MCDRLVSRQTERALRAVALGRKNWLFAGSDDGGERGANIHTLLGTARLYDLNPEAYLRYVLEPIADHPITDIDQQLIWPRSYRRCELQLEISVPCFAQNVPLH